MRTGLYFIIILSLAATNLVAKELNIYAVSASGAAEATPTKPNIIAGINKNNLIRLDIITLRLNLYFKISLEISVNKRYSKLTSIRY